MATAFITSIFNPAGYKNKLSNYNKFKTELENRKIKDLFTAELTFGDQEFALEKGKKVFQFRAQDVLWQKERLLNLLLHELPAKYDSVAWVDADIVFTSPGDVTNQINSALEEHHVIQVFSTYSQSYPTKNTPYHCWAKYPGKGHPGFGWAARREFLDKHKLYDATPLIGADYLMAIAFSGLEKDHYLSHLNYASLKHFFSWANKLWTSPVSLGFIDQHITHLWHGSFENRKYFPCLNYLVEEDFDPQSDIQINSNGLWEWASQKPTLHQRVNNYFHERKEDEIPKPIQNYFDHVYCLNLTRRKNKWEKVAPKIRRAGFRHLTRFNAIDGYTTRNKKLFTQIRNTPMSEYERLHLNRKAFCSPGAVGCLLSYIKIIEDAKKKGYKRILCFEDDIRFHKNFKILSEQISNVPNNWKLLYLGASQYLWHGIKPNNGYYEAKSSMGTFGFAIDESIYDLLLDRFKKMEVPVDNYLAFHIQPELAGQCFVFYPNLVIADVENSDIRPEQNQTNIAKIMQWNLTDYSR